jgi:hypothetical protein
MMNYAFVFHLAMKSNLVLLTEVDPTSWGYSPQNCTGDAARCLFLPITNCTVQTVNKTLITNSGMWRKFGPLGVPPAPYDDQEARLVLGHGVQRLAAMDIWTK